MTVAEILTSARGLAAEVELDHLEVGLDQMWETMGEASFDELIAQVRQTT